MTTTERQTSFKQRNPQYFKNYYLKNKNKYNQNRKKKWYGVKIYGTMYYFDKKSDIKIKTLDEDDLGKTSCVHITAV